MKKLLLTVAVLLLGCAGFAASSAQDVRSQKNNVLGALNQEGQTDYFYHQNLLFRVEDLNKEYAKLKRENPAAAASVLPDLAGEFNSSRYGRVTLLHVISILENYDWSSFATVEVQARELKRDLSNLPNLQDKDIQAVVLAAGRVREAGVWEASLYEYYWQNLMGAVESLEYKYAALKAKKPLHAAIALRAINTNDYRSKFHSGSLLGLMEDVDSHLLVTDLQAPNLYRDLRDLQ